MADDHLARGKQKIGDSVLHTVLTEECVQGSTKHGENIIRHISASGLVPPCGGKLVNLVVKHEERKELTQYATELPSVRLTLRSLCDLELLSIGAFSLLDRFMRKADYTRVLEQMCLVNGTLFSIPITLPVVNTRTIRGGEPVTLRSPKNDLLAIMTVEGLFEWNPDEEDQLVLGTEGSLSKFFMGSMNGIPRLKRLDDPYEEPINPEIRLHTTNCLPEENARRIIRYLIKSGFFAWRK